MSRYAVKITKEDLEQKIIALVNKNRAVTDHITDLDMALYGLTSGECECKFVADISKVDVDGENSEIETFVSDGDLNYFLAWKAGDWQNPVYYAIYHDGKNVRGYVPDTPTNYNLKTKCAFGEDEDADKKYLAKIGIDFDNSENELYEVLEANFDELKAAIRNRILVR